MNGMWQLGGDGWDSRVRSERNIGTADIIFRLWRKGV